MPWDHTRALTDGVGNRSTSIALTLYW